MSDGSVRHPIDVEEVKAAAREARKNGAAGIAIAFYHAYRNPAHEVAAREAIQAELGDFEVSISSEIWPQIGEYERAVVAVLNAFVKPKMKTYIADIEQYLSDKLPNSRLFITRSNGGAMAASEARQFPVQTLLSGPASGVAAALSVSERLDGGQYLTFDMGGTSTDVALIRDNQATISSSAEVGDFPLSMPVTEIEAIGAGGGSIISLDGRVLRVGPRSAGARPGPACFGRGGTEPSVSDAYVLCGYLDPDYFLGGKMKLDSAAAEKAFFAISNELHQKAVVCAEAALTVATSNMVARVLPYLARHGTDPEDVTLVLYGGAGSLHGPLLAAELGIRRVLIPPTPSVFCASGGLVAKLIHDLARTVQGLNLDAGRLAAQYKELESEARHWLDQQINAHQLVSTEIERYADMRYRGQSFQLQVKVDEQGLATGSLDNLINSFHDEHQRLYTHSDRAAEVEILQIRVRISGSLAAPGLEEVLPSNEEATAKGRRTIQIAGESRVASVYDRAAISSQAKIVGPAIIDQTDTTILVPPMFTATVNGFGDLILTRE